MMLWDPSIGGYSSTQVQVTLPCNDQVKGSPKVRNMKDVQYEYGKAGGVRIYSIPEIYAEVARG